jgi:hypothetical protein
VTGPVLLTPEEIAAVRTTHPGPVHTALTMAQRGLWREGPARPCGACGELLTAGRGGRTGGRRWWCDTPACRLERARQGNAASRARRRARSLEERLQGEGTTAARAVAVVRRHVAEPRTTAEVLAMLGLDGAVVAA